MTTLHADPNTSTELRVAIGRVAHRLRQLWALGEARDGISFTEGALLTHLIREGASSPTSLAGNERVTSQAITAHLEKAASLDPNTVERWHRLFFNHEITRNFAAAWKALDRVLALQPDSWYYYSHQASLLYFWNGDLSLAEQMLSRPRSGTGR